MFKRPITKFITLAMVVAAGLAGCDTASGPQAAPGERSADYLDFRWAQPISSVVTTTEDVTTSTVTAVIGRTGGKIQNGPHVLTVPNKAVDGETEFTFTVVGDGYVHVDLKAKRVSDGLIVSIFPQALTLRLSYQGANVTDPSRLVVAWLMDGTVSGAKQRMPGSVDQSGKSVVALIPHFSDFVMAVN